MGPMKDRELKPVPSHETDRYKFVPTEGAQPLPVTLQAAQATFVTPQQFFTEPMQRRVATLTNSQNSIKQCRSRRCLIEFFGSRSHRIVLGVSN